VIAYILVSVGGYLYVRRMLRSPHRWENLKKMFRSPILPLLVFFTLTYDKFFAVCRPVFQSLFLFIEPTIRSVQNGTLSWRQIVSYVLGMVVVFGICFYARRILYSSDRRTELRKTFRILGIPVLALSLLCWTDLAHAAALLPSLTANVVGGVLWLPSYLWLCFYVEPYRYIVYGGRISLELGIGAAVVFLAHSGFMRILRRIPAHHGRLFSVTIYLCLWLIFIASCLSRTIWMLVLIAVPSVWCCLQLRHILNVNTVSIEFPQRDQELLRKAGIFLLAAFVVSILVWNLAYVYPQYLPVHQWAKAVYNLFAIHYSYPLMELFGNGTFSWGQGIPLAVLAMILVVALGALVRQRTKRFPNVELPKSPRSHFLLQFILLASVNVVLIVVNVLCLVHVWGSDSSIQLSDIRFWPWWLMVIPFSLVVFAVSALAALRKWKSVAVILLLLFVFPNAVLADVPTIRMLEPAKFVSAKDAREAAKHESKPGQGGYLADPVIVDCFAAMEYTYTGGRYENEPIKFRLRSPSTIEPDKKYPMLIWFHGRGESGDDNTRQLAHLQKTIDFFAGPNQQDFFLLATQCPKDNNQWTRSIEKDGKGDAPMTIAAEIMEAVLREFPVDENRLSCCGFSSGGTGSWEFARISPRPLAGMGACSGNPVKAATAEEYLGPAIWVFNNMGDAGVSYEDAVTFIDEINANGGNAFLTLYDAKGHNSWDRAMQEEKILGWLILQNLAKPGPPQGIIGRALPKTRQFTMFGLPVLIIVGLLLPRAFGRKGGKPCE